MITWSSSTRLGTIAVSMSPIDSWPSINVSAAMSHRPRSSRGDPRGQRLRQVGTRRALRDLETALGDLGQVDRRQVDLRRRWLRNNRCRDGLRRCLLGASARAVDANRVSAINVASLCMGCRRSVQIHVLAPRSLRAQRTVRACHLRGPTLVSAACGCFFTAMRRPGPCATATA